MDDEVDKYPFIFNTAPSPRTVQRIRETLEVRRSAVAKFVDSSNEYMNGYIDAYESVIESLKELEEQLKYRKR